jgi:hypothetical protein
MFSKNPHSGRYGFFPVDSHNDKAEPKASEQPKSGPEKLMTAPAVDEYKVEPTAEYSGGL